MLSYINWNVDPEIVRINLEFIKLGALSIRWYGLLFASGFLIGYYICEKMLKTEKVKEKWIESLFFYILIATIVGARLGHVFFYGWDYYSQNPGEIIKVWHGGLASHGGAVGILLALYIHSKKITKRSVLWSLDRIAGPVALVGAFIRTGNLMNSEIYGIETTLPWGFVFQRVPETVAKHPTQIYEALCYLLIFAFLFYKYWKTDAKDKQGMLTGIFFSLVFGARFLIEFIKEDQEMFEAGMALNMGQWLSIPLVILGVYLWVRAIKSKPVFYKND